MYLLQDMTILDRAEITKNIPAIGRWIQSTLNAGSFADSANPKLAQTWIPVPGLGETNPFATMPSTWKKHPVALLRESWDKFCE
jgi:hypothetical protein